MWDWMKIVIAFFMVYVLCFGYTINGVHHGIVDCSYDKGVVIK
jgi:hypothetical protein